MRTASGLAFALVALAAASVLLGALARGADAAPKKPSKPNVVIILTDDQRADDMKWMPKTRKLLAAKGTTFSRFMAPFPLCCPARMSIMTGQYPHNHGVDGNFPPEGYYGLSRAEQMKTLPVWLKKAGYQTSHVGKYLNGYGSLNQTEVPPGWTDWHGSIDQTSYDMFNYWLNDNGRVTKYGSDPWNEAIMQFSAEVARETYPDYQSFSQALAQKFIFSALNDGNFGTPGRKDHQVDVLADRAVGFVRDASRKKAPFFLQFAPPSPHREDLPENAGYRGINPRPPARYADKVQGLSFTNNPPSFDEADISDKPGLLSAFKPLGEYRTGRPEISGLQAIENYRRGRVGNLWALDDAVSGIVSELKKRGELDNTVIIFNSDNGWLLGEHRIPGDKYMAYEESLMVPAIISGPGWPKGKTVSALTSNFDLTKTILDATGAKANRVQDGVPLLPLAQGKAKPREAMLLEATRDLFVKPGFPYQWDKPYIGVRTDRFKYVNWSTGGEELYDLKADPYEMENLADDPALAAEKARLLALAEKLRACKGKACVVR